MLPLGTDRHRLQDQLVRLPAALSREAARVGDSGVRRHSARCVRRVGGAVRVRRGRARRDAGCRVAAAGTSPSRERVRHVRLPTEAEAGREPHFCLQARWSPAVGPPPRRRWQRRAIRVPRAQRRYFPGAPPPAATWGSH